MEVYGTDYPTPDGTCVRDYIHVSDLVAAHAMALAYLRAGGKSDVFNCGYTRGFSVLEVIEAVNKAAGLKIDARLSPRRAGDPAAIVAASTKVRETLGWTPQHDDLNGIVTAALNWERQLETLKKAS